MTPTKLCSGKGAMAPAAPYLIAAMALAFLVGLEIRRVAVDCRITYTLMVAPLGTSTLLHTRLGAVL